MSELATNYLAALRSYDDDDPGNYLPKARQLGVTAVRMGIDALKLAKIHETALEAMLVSSAKSRNGEISTERTTAFFHEALLPIEKAYLSEREAEQNAPRGDWDQLNKDLADSQRLLVQKNQDQQQAEDALQTSKETCSQLLKESRLLQEELRLLSRRLLSVQEEERKRISRDLHDLIAQTLTGINLQLALFKSKAISDAEGFHQKIEQTQHLIEKSVETVHRFARSLRPAILDDLGLIPALKSHLKDFIEDTGIRVSLTAFAGISQLDNESQTTLFRVVQEALNNVAQHSKASRAEVTIKHLPEKVRMEIHDNGIGFEANIDAFFGKQSKRLGLLGMKERVEMSGGRFWVESTPGKESTVFAEIPFETRTPGDPSN